MNRGKPKEITHSAGGVVFRREGGIFYFALIQDGYGKWTFPKGKIESGETEERAAIAEIEEELGVVNPRVLGKIGSILLRVTSRYEKPYPFLKKVHYYLIESKQKKIEHERQNPGILDAQWFQEQDVPKQLGYTNSKKIFHKAVAILKKLESHN